MEKPGRVPSTEPVPSRADLGASDPAQEDIALLAQAGQGDDRAFNMLVLAHSGFVHTLALRYLQNAADADDVAQAVFLSLWSAASKWRPDARLRTWLYRVTVNKCIDRARRARRWRWLSGGPSPEDVEATIPDMRAGGAQSVEAASELKRVRHAMASLAPRQRMALLLVAEQELRVAEAAAIMEVSAGAFEQLLVRGRKTLRERLETEDG